MTAVLTRLLGMNARELRRAIPLFLYLFLTMAGTVASKAARDALFLERFRAVDLSPIHSAWFGRKSVYRVAPPAA